MVLVGMIEHFNDLSQDDQTQMAIIQRRYAVTPTPLPLARATYGRLRAGASPALVLGEDRQHVNDAFLHFSPTIGSFLHFLS